MCEKPTNATIIHSVYQLCMVAPTCFGITPIHNILSTAPQLSTSQKVLRTLPEDGNVMPKHVGTTIHN
jgi:hypothetical protein